MTPEEMIPILWALIRGRIERPDLNSTMDVYLVEQLMRAGLNDRETWRLIAYGATSLAASLIVELTPDHHAALDVVDAHDFDNILGRLLEGTQP